MGTAIAIRNQSFMDAFQKFVAEKQEEINRVNALQGLYAGVQDAMEVCADIKNDSFRLGLGTESVNLSFTANDQTTREDFWKVWRAVRDALVARRLIEPNGGTYPSWKDITPGAVFQSVQKKNGKQTLLTVYLFMYIPEEGTRHIKVAKKYEEYKSTYPVYAIQYDDRNERPAWDIDA